MKKIIIIIIFIFLFITVTNNYSFNDELISENSNNIKNIKIPKYNDMVPQGLAIKDDLILISYYDPYGKNNSLIYVLNKNGDVLNISSLDIISHVGGIAYDKNNLLLWVAGENGFINVYYINDILNKKDAVTKYKAYVGEDLINYQISNKTLVSSLTIDDDYLYVSSFSLNQEGILKKYKINVDVRLDLIFENKVKIPDKVQGITFYQKDDLKYIIFSTSFGRKNNSYIISYLYDEDILDYRTNNNYIIYELPPMLEQVVLENDYLYALYESNATIYSNCPNISEEITAIHINNLISNE